MKYLVSGVVLVLIAGGGWAQYQLGQEAGRRIDQQLAPDTLSRWTGMPVEVLANEQHSGWLETRGSVRLATPSSDIPLDMTVEYVIHHRLTDVVSGFEWSASLTTLYVGGPVNVSLIDQVFGGQPVLVDGRAEPGQVSGVVTVPAASWVLDGIDTLEAQAFPIRFGLQQGENLRLGAYNSQADVPPIRISGPDLKLEINGLGWRHEYSGQADVLAGHLDLAIAEIRAQNGMAFVATGIHNRMDTRISTELESHLSFSIEHIQSPLGEMQGLLLETAFGGLDGSLTRQLLDQLDDASQSGDPALVMVELNRFLEQNADQWFSRAPWFRLEHFRFNQGDEPFIDLSGNLTLQTSRLAPDFFAGWMKGAMPDPLDLMNVLDASVDMSLSQDAIALATLSNPLMGDLLANNGPAFSFRMSQGQMTLNGNPLE